MRTAITFLMLLAIPTLAIGNDHCYSPPPKPQISAEERAAIAKEAARVAEVRRKAKARLERLFAKKRKENETLEKRLAATREALEADLNEVVVESQADESGARLEQSSLNAIDDHDRKLGKASRRAASIEIDASKAFSESLQRSAIAVEKANTLQAIENRQSSYSGGGSHEPYCPPQPPCPAGRTCSIDESRCQ